MLILSDARLTVGVYGLGLIGSTIATALERLSRWQLHSESIEWASPEASIARSVDALQAAGRQSARTVVIWSAGVCGFGATQAQTSAELKTFSMLLERCRDVGLLADADLHVVSSAGGLFEGQIGITGGSTPESYRPYSSLKLDQEAYAQTLVDPKKLHIYRPSSVYGRVRKGHRLGLVSTLVKNTFERRVTHLVGRTYSLRDYVWADDIGEYVARRVYANAQSQEAPHVLAQGKPSSVFEIQRTVESVMGRRTYISFDLKGDNDRHTTFAPTALPSHWHPHTIAFGVRAIVEDFRTYRRAA